MSYCSYAEYLAAGGSSAISPTDYSRIEPEAERIVDINTTGLDNVRKLALYFPTDKADACAVKRCVAKLTMAIYRAEQLEEAAFAASLSAGGAVSHRSSGSESITYGAGSSEIANAVSDGANLDKVYRAMVIRGLRGVCDANGVSLLYMGAYYV